MYLPSGDWCHMLVAITILTVLVSFHVFFLASPYMDHKGSLMMTCCLVAIWSCSVVEECLLCWKSVKSFNVDPL